jgi:RNA polymerase sigma-70 factor (ECF subfamily)
VKKNNKEIDWDNVYEICLPRVFHYFCYKVDNAHTAEELTAQTFEKAWANRRHYKREMGEVQPWLIGIARHVVGDYFRQTPHETDLDEAQWLSSQSTLEDDLQRHLDFERVLHILSNASLQERDLVALKYGAELTNREIARISGLSESNVGTILHRVITRIRKEWEKKDE